MKIKLFALLFFTLTAQHIHAANTHCYCKITTDFSTVSTSSETSSIYFKILGTDTTEPVDAASCEAACKNAGGFVARERLKKQQPKSVKSKIEFSLRSSSPSIKELRKAIAPDDFFPARPTKEEFSIISAQ